MILVGECVPVGFCAEIVATREEIIDVDSELRIVLEIMQQSPLRCEFLIVSKVIVELVIAEEFVVIA